MDNCLFKDTPTKHRVRVGNKLRVVYARHDWDGRFVRFVAHHTPAEVRKIQRTYLPAKVGVCDWWEVPESYFVNAG